MDMSNKSLALLLVAAIVVSLGTTMLSINKLNRAQESLTGNVASYGDVNLSITSLMQCDVLGDVNFGASTSKPNDEYNLSTDRTHTGSWTTDCTSGTTCSGMMVNNTGNIDINVTFNSTQTGTTWAELGNNRAADWFRYHAENGMTTGAQTGCAAGQIWSTTTNIATNNNRVCDNLSYINDNSLTTIEFNVTVNENTPPGSKTALITVTCQQTD